MYIKVNANGLIEATATSNQGDGWFEVDRIPSDMNAYMYNGSGFIPRPTLPVPSFTEDAATWVDLPQGSVIEVAGYRHGAETDGQYVLPLADWPEGQMVYVDAPQPFISRMYHRGLTE